MIKKALWLFILPVYLLMSCNKDMATADNPPEITTPVLTSPVPNKQVSSDIQGTILDEKNKPLPGAQVKCGDASATTDANGSFIINKVNAVEAAAVVTVQKDGYFNGFRTFRIAAADKLQYVQIQLLPKTVTGTFEAVTGGNVSAANAQFIFQPQSALDADNKPYDGKVSLLYSPINPERPDFADIMPGDLRGINSSNDLVGLKSYGMMALELQGESGEKLHLDSTKPVTFKMTIPGSLLNTAPVNIPLWHFEESSGLWREEGSAIRTGDSYVGIVKHFSYWNCDGQFPIVNIKATLQDDNGIPLANMAVYIRRTNGEMAMGYTNETGLMSGDVPKGETLIMEIYSKCNTVIASRNIGPFSDSTNLGIVKMAVPENTFIHFSGAVTSCEGASVKNGTVSISLDGIVYRTDITDGKYKTTIHRCVPTVATAIINAVDADANKMSTVEMPVTIDSYVRDLVACDVIQPDVINADLNGQPYNFINPADSIVLANYQYSYLLYTRKNANKPNEQQLNLSIDTVAVGTYNTNNLNIRDGNLFYHGNGTYTLTQAGSLGGYIEGSFSGNVAADSTAGFVPLTGTFKVRVSQ